VTLGAGAKGGRSGAPAVCDHAYVGIGVCAYGPIRLGRNCKIGPGVVVWRDVADNEVLSVAEPVTLSFKGNRPEHAQRVAAEGMAAE
jgi:serine acetyltransferase